MKHEIENWKMTYKQEIKYIKSNSMDCTDY